MVPVFEAEIRGVATGFLLERRVVGLRQVNKPAVIAKIKIFKLGTFVETQSPANQALEVSDQEVGQIERASFRLRDFPEIVGTGIELITMRAWQAFDTEFLQNFIESAAGSAITVGHKYSFVLPNAFLQFGADGRWYFLRLLMQRRGQAPHPNMAPLIQPHNLHELSGKSTTGNQQNGWLHRVIEAIGISDAVIFPPVVLRMQLSGNPAGL